MVPHARAMAKFCTRSDLPRPNGEGTFDCMVDVIDEEPGKYTFHWTVDSSQEFVESAVHLKEDDAWLSLGFGSSCRSDRAAYPFTTTNCDMVPAIAAIAEVNGEGDVSVGTYNITGLSTSQITSTSNAEGLMEVTGGVSSGEVDGTIMYITLKMVDEDVGASLDLGTSMNYAFGSSGNLAVHDPSNAGTFTVEMASEPEDEDTEPEEDSQSTEEQVQPEEEGVDRANVVKGECPPSPLTVDRDPNGNSLTFECRQPLTADTMNDVVLDWAVSEDGNSLTVALSARTDGYLAIGFPVRAGNMVPADAVIGACSSADETLEVRPYKISDDSSSGVVVDNDQVISNQGCMYEDGLTTVYFTREVENGGQVALELSEEGMPLIFASGDTSDLVHHGSSRGAVQVNFESSEIEQQAVAGSTDRKSHGILMAVAWICMLPLGGAVGKLIQKMRRSPCICKLLFYTHAILQLFGLVIATAGFAVAVGKFDAGISKVPYGHGTIGVIVMALTFFQPINALVRPDAALMKTRRRVWEFVHASTGKCALLLGAFNVFTGIHILAINFGEIDQSLWVALCAGSLCLIVFSRDMVEKYCDQEVYLQQQSCDKHDEHRAYPDGDDGGSAASAEQLIKGDV
eukprot:CAMPEP_0183829804 /NCGR_PEP_ID=MMETSP0807_2-20130328/3603_1 /TAXON_ID=88271 /ORGANISM="Picocystis salinarum, Strain CCMP1897" /LENGTH=626 /DNA_ID=CAMNT_0026075093 /DNA_START=87 /DNA_END=1967 /DNA_ORIENTATION=+